MAVRNSPSQSVVVVTGNNLFAQYGEKSDPPGIQVQVYIDGTFIQLPTGTACGGPSSYRFDGGVINGFSSATIRLVMDSGYTVLITPGLALDVSALYTVQLIVPVSAFGRVAGLLGNANGDPDDDFVDLNGVDWGTDAWGFGNAMHVDPADSLFVFTPLCTPGQAAHNAVLPYNLSQLLQVAPPSPDYPNVWYDVALQAAANATCFATMGGFTAFYRFCMYDIYLTGSFDYVDTTHAGAVNNAAFVTAPQLMLVALGFNNVTLSLLFAGQQHAGSLLPNCSAALVNTTQPVQASCVALFDQLVAPQWQSASVTTATVSGGGQGALYNVTVLVTGLQPSTAYSFRGSFWYPAGSAHDAPRSGFAYVVATTLGCVPTCNSDPRYLPCGDNGCGGVCGFCSLYYNCSLYTNLPAAIQLASQANTSVCTAGAALTAALLPTNATNATSVVGDPVLVGFRGQRFQVHGIDGAVYNLITEPQLFINARFGFLEGPRPCPVMPSTGLQSAACWSHPGSYLTEVAVAARSPDGCIHRLLIAPGDASVGFTQILYNGKVLAQRVGMPRWEGTGEGVMVKRVSSHELDVRVGHFALRLDSIDGFANIALLELLPPARVSTLRSHGLLGQTWSKKRYKGPLPELEGVVDDYLLTDDDVFGTSFPFNLFELERSTSAVE